MMKKALFVTIIYCNLLTATFVVNASEFWDMKRVDVSSSLNITFDTNNHWFERTRAQRNQHKKGWVEDGTWHASRAEGVAEVGVLIASLYDGRAFQKKHVKKIREHVKIFFGQSDLDYGEQGILKTNSGSIDYIFYRMGAQACVFIRKYWSDPELQGDIAQLNSTYSWVVGSNYIVAYYCKPSRENLRKTDMALLFNGIEARNLYWPSNMFAIVGADYIYNETSEILAKSKDQPNDLTGTYHSEVTGNWGLALGLKSANPEVKLEQKGSEVEGTYGLNGGKILGRVDGSTINFKWIGSGSRSGTGKWVFKQGSNDIEGSWITGHGIHMSGTWNLKGDPKQIVSEADKTTVDFPRSEIDLSGVYTSNVLRKNNVDYFCFNQKRTFMIKLKQKNNSIKGTFMSGITGEIEGTLIKNKVSFTWYTARCNAGKKGEWVVDSSGSSLRGFGSNQLDWEAQKIN